MQLSIKNIRTGLLALVLLLLLAPAKGQVTGTGEQDTVDLTARSKEMEKAVLVTGTVTDAATHRPLSAIRVSYQDFSAAITDSLGQFSLKVPDHHVAVVLSGEGYQSKEIALRGRNTISAALYEDGYISFYDAANLPFTNVSRNQLPFAVTSIQTGGNWNRTAESPDAFLQGKSAGLQAVRRSGTPNIGANLFLRGISSLYATNQPLVVIDGLVYDNKDYGGSLIANNYTNPLAYVDVKDIDNITIVKDGSSTYGVKGGNGVIIITTARAKELATRIDFALYSGINFSPKRLPVMNAANYRTYLSDLLQSAGIPENQVRNYAYMNDDPANPDYYRYHNQTDWQKKVFDNSFLKNYYLKVTGGDNIAKYALSMGLLTNAGVIRQADMNRYNTRFNADLNLSRRLTATANLSFTFNEQNLKDQGLAPKTNPIYSTLIKSPFIGVYEVSDKGLESPSLSDSDTFNVSNPVALVNTTKGLNKNYRFLGSMGFNYALSKAFTLSTILGVTLDKIRESSFIPRKGVVNDTLADGTIADSRLGTQTKRLLSIYNDTRLSYDQTFRRIHHLAVRAGIRFQQSRTEQDLGQGANSATDELISVGNGVSTLRRTGGDIGEVRWLNTYLSSDYSLSDKYFLSFNMAVDGSSRFGKKISGGAVQISGNSFAILPSLAGAWLISSENFIADNRFIDLLKLRASIGLSGNDDVGNYAARQTYSSQNLLGVQGLVRSNIGNDGLQWESVRKINLGLDVALFNERVSLAFDAYRNKTSDMIINEPIPTAAGLGYAMTNSGGLKTTGVEATITGRIIHQSSLKWDLGITVAHYASEITKLPANEIMTNYAGASILSRAGEGPNLFYGHKTKGIYSTDAEASADGFVNKLANGTAVPLRGGDVRFLDLNNDKIIDDKDRQVIGDPNPAFFGSLSSRAEWKHWALEGLFTFTQGNDIYNYTRRQIESQATTANQTNAVINRWRSNGQNTGIPRASLGDPTGNSRFSDRWIEDGSYFRLRTATISYTVSPKSGFLRYCVVYLTGNNLFTLTEYLGYDPEFSGTTSVLGQGVDITLEPQHRSVQLGVRFGL